MKRRLELAQRDAQLAADAFLVRNPGVRRAVQGAEQALGRARQWSSSGSLKGLGEGGASGVSGGREGTSAGGAGGASGRTGRQAGSALGAAGGLAGSTSSPDLGGVGGGGAQAPAGAPRRRVSRVNSPTSGAPGLSALAEEPRSAGSRDGHIGAGRDEAPALSVGFRRGVSAAALVESEEGAPGPLALPPSRPATPPLGAAAPPRGSGDGAATSDDEAAHAGARDAAKAKTESTAVGRVVLPRRGQGKRPTAGEGKKGAVGGGAAVAPIPAPAAPVASSRAATVAAAPKPDAWGSLQLGPLRLPLPRLPALLADRLRRRHGSIADAGRRIAIVTTAALPWMTGTSVNPLLRAAYLERDGRDKSRKVTLLVPWLHPDDQAKVFPASAGTFASPELQERFIRAWVDDRVGFATDFAISFYPGRYAPEKCSILGVGDITRYVSDAEADVAVLEEPEHLNWYHHGRRWTDKFRHVVGVCHTNYLDYARREEDGRRKATALGAINAWVCRSHCHKVIKLSGAVQTMPRESTEFVHGVSPAFLRVGDRKAAEARAARERGGVVAGAGSAGAGPSSGGKAPTPAAVAGASTGSGAAGSPPSPGPGNGPRPSVDLPGGPEASVFNRGAYFIGKAIWAKGYTELLDQLDGHAARTGERIPLDVYGSGEDLDAIRARAAAKKLDMTFHGARDHLDESIHAYKVFVNPSTSDVVATTTAEALAMGKIVVLPDLPCNRFFGQFENCLLYGTPEEFTRQLSRAVRAEPAPLSAEDRHRLTWEAATERFLRVAEIDAAGRTNPLERALDWGLAKSHNFVSGVEGCRRAMGAGAGTRDDPEGGVAGYRPSAEDLGGFFDAHERSKAYHSRPGGGGAAAAAVAATPGGGGGLEAVGGRAGEGLS